MTGLTELGVALAGGGVWGVLRIAVRGRLAVALERQRATSAVRILERLPPGGSLCETDRDGQCRLIVVPETGPARRPAGEDDPR